VAHVVSKLLRAVALATAGVVATVSVGTAQEALGPFGVADRGARIVQAQSEQYIRTIWVDPDGCEHWVMDDGVEGYMSPHVNRQGIPVCRRGNVCGMMQSDQFFKTDSYHINAAGKQGLAEFFRSTGATAYIITGHTDSRASDEYNMRMSYNRAASVAKVAQSVGARMSDVRGYGERMPRASNNSSTGMAKNRRVEIFCIR
jgi:Outer membrane protein and related peptidoglycan-associated (lipo)proteins